MNRSSKNLPRYATLVEMLRCQARHQREDRGYTFLVDGERHEAHQSYAALDYRARAIAAALNDIASPGDRVLLVFTPGLDYLAGLFGCLYAGMVAVPTFPLRPNRPNPRQEAIARDAQPAVALTSRSVLEGPDAQLAQCPDLQRLHWLHVDSVSQSRADDWDYPAVTPQSLAVLQYTSGSTGVPKGVMLTHGNLLYNLEAIRRAFRPESHDVGVCWLPPYHDMGLIGGLLEVMYVGSKTLWMSPAAFIQKPIRWLEAVSRTGATVSGGPNFAYDLCVRRISHQQRQSLDLSSWRVAFNGAEPIAAETLDRFAETYAPYGFRREAFTPCYGLAEATLMVSTSHDGELPRVFSVRRDALAHHRYQPAAADADVVRLVGCGAPIAGQELLIVEPQTCQPCQPGQIGEVWVRGPSVGQGYWNQVQATEDRFGGRLAGANEHRYLRTGDLGFLADDELVITGRHSDLIIIRGRNYYPQEIERAVDECHPALRASGGAAFAVQVDGVQRLAIVHELDRSGRRTDPDEIVSAIRRTVAEQFELDVYAVALIRTSSIAKTSSGKIRRAECRQRFLDDQLETLARWTAASAPGAAPPQTRVQPADRAVGREEIEQWLVARMSGHLNLLPEQIDITRPFAYYGLDSVTLVTVSAELESWLGRPVSPTLLYDEPTIAALASSLAGRDSQPDTSTLVVSTPPAVSTAAEPIAVVGMACRFPGAESPDAFWQLLHQGQEAIGPPPSDRAPWFDTRSNHHGGFLDGVDLFDAELFGIAPREAAWIDPQHRLLLEVTWESLERAGLPPQMLAGKRVGVFVGISNGDYARLLARDPASVGPYFGTGNSPSMAAHRVSYHFDLRGPSLAIDTACSSSLVAIHVACQSLRSGESEAAIVGGVNLILASEVTSAFAQAQMLSPSGHCHTFDAAADGYVRGEGCGVVVLKRLSDAQAAGDRILAVIRGSAINQDGRSNGITAPNGAAQESLIRQAIQNAGTTPDKIGYIEAHGTGTILGDPIEMNALKAVLASKTDGGMDCWIGSVKTNIGHLESAAGIAGLIKVILALEHHEVPPHLHLQRLNPHIDLQATGLSIPTTPQPWPAGRPLAGVSSFGFGGTNAHVILEAPPPLEPAPQSATRPRHLLALSAGDEPALREMAARYAARLAETPDHDLADFCHTANTTRARLAQRLAVSGRSARELGQALAGFAAGKQGNVRCGRVSPQKAPSVAFLFTGQGAQYVGMGRQLYHTLPEFRVHVDRCDELLRPWLPQPLLSVIYPDDEDASLIHQTGYTQPALFAIEYALTQVLVGWGVTPAAVMGHSLGEYVAACVAGVFGLEDGLRLVARRAALVEQLPAGGQMAAVWAPYDVVAEAIGQHGGEVAIAAINGPDNIVVSGHRPVVRSLIEQLERRGFSAQPLVVSHAFHSPLVEPVLDTFEQMADELRYEHPAIRYVSNVSGSLANGDVSAGRYWRHHLRQPVQFAAGVDTLVREGINVFVEIGPHPTLLGLLRRCRPEGVGLTLPTLSRGREEWEVLLDALAGLFAGGVEVNWDAVAGAVQRRRVDLPAYPFQRQRYWFEGNAVAGVPSAAPAAPLAVPPSDTLRDTARQLQQQYAVARYAALEPEADLLVAAYVVAAFDRLGCPWQSTGVHTADSLADAMQIAPQHRPLAARFCEILAEDGHLVRKNAGYLIPARPQVDDPARLAASLGQRFPECAGELAVATRCGEHLADVLAGRAEPLAVLFADGSTAALETLYERAPIARYSNALVQQAVAEIVARLPSDRPLRVLEIGAGTGGTTSSVLPILPPQRVEYHFTDVSNLFTWQAEQKFADYRFMRYGLLDIEQPPAAQGLPEYAFDIVLAANVLHATADLAATLGHVDKLLAADGWLVLLEGTRRHRLLDLVFGLTEGWWKFRDRQRRPDHPLLPAPQWTALLLQLGYRQALAVPSAGDGLIDGGQAVIVAQAPAGRRAPAPQSTSPLRAPRHELPAATGQPQDEVRTDLAARLRQASADQRRELVEEAVRRLVAGVLGSEPERLDLDQPVTNLGLDSLMAIQLKNQIETQLAVAMPLTAFLQGASGRQLMDKLIEQIAAPDAAPRQAGDATAQQNGSEIAHVASGISSAPRSAEEIQPSLEHVDQLSETELDALLGRLLTEAEHESPPRNP